MKFYIPRHGSGPIKIPSPALTIADLQDCADMSVHALGCVVAILPKHLTAGEAITAYTSLQDLQAELMGRLAEACGEEDIDDYDVPADVLDILQSCGASFYGLLDLLNSDDPVIAL